MTPIAPRAEGRVVERVAIPTSDDVDLDALMVRVRDAARGGSASGGALQAQSASDEIARELDLIRVLEAQGEWNEHARQALMALTDAIRALRDDWAEVQAGLRREIAQLTAQVEQLRAPAGTRRKAASPRGSGTRRPGVTRKRR